MTPCAILIMAHDRADVQAVVEACQFLAEHQIQRGRVPHVYASGVRYEREQHSTLPGVERVQTPEEVVAMGFGDCDDLAPYLAGSRNVLDGYATEPMRIVTDGARVLAVESPGIGYHIVIEYPDGTIEDPSARLGMFEVGRVTSEQRRKRALAFMRTATKLAREASKLAPGSRARESIFAHAETMARRGRAEAQRADEDDAREEAEGEAR